MYETFYGFKEKPFSMLPDPGFLYLSKKHQAALTLLEYGLLNHVGFCVISGEAGSGKTTILRAMLERIGDDITVGMITNTHQSFGGLLDWVLSAFDLHQPNLTHVEMHQLFVDYLIEQYANSHTVLLIVDEAQNMKAEALEELRMLSNVNSEKDQLMQVVLAGQPALKDTLRLPELKQFAQRIAVDYHLEPLGLQESCGYIQHRLVTAGATRDIFTPAACERIHCYSGGTPRLINLLCETVLVYGFADQQELIDVALVDEMVQERMKDSVVPIVNRDIVEREECEPNEELVKDFPWICPEGGTAGLKPQVDASDAEEKEIISEYVTPDIDDFAATGDDFAATEAIAETETPGEEEKVTTEDIRVSEEAESEAETGTPQEEPAAETAVQAGAASGYRDDVLEAQPADKPGSAVLVVEAENSDTGRQLKKFGLLAGVFALILVAVAVILDEDVDIEAVKNEAIELQKQREQEAARMRQLQLEAQALKRERDAALAKAEAEKQAKLEAERVAAEKAALEAKIMEQQRKLEEQKRMAAAREREQKALQAEAQAKAEAKFARQEAEKLEQERLLMQQRLDEEIRLKQVEEARRLELEQLRKEQAARELAAKEQAAGGVDRASGQLQEKKTLPEECTGPTARFKSGCR